MTQTEEILARLRRNGERGLTPREALNDLGCMRLAARVRELRLDGYLILNEGASFNRKHFAKYVLKETHQLSMDEVAR